MKIQGRMLKNGLLSFLFAGITLAVSGCLSVHVHKDEHKDAGPTVVVPEDHPAPPPP